MTPVFTQGARGQGPGCHQLISLGSDPPASLPFLLVVLSPEVTSATDQDNPDLSPQTPGRFSVFLSSVP